MKTLKEVGIVIGLVFLGMILFWIWGNLNNILGIIILLIIPFFVWLSPSNLNQKSFIENIKNYKLHKIRLTFFIILMLFMIIGWIWSLNPERKIVPEINITSSLDKQNTGEYLLTFNTKNAKEIQINWENIQLVSGDNYSKSIQLKNIKTNISILAKTPYQQAQKDITIERNLTAEEVKQQEQEAEKARLVAESNKKLAEENQAKAKENAKKAQIEKLQKEISWVDKFDWSQFRSDITSINLELGLFWAYAIVIEEWQRSEYQEVKDLANKLKTKVSALQVKEFPLLRSAYSKLMDKTLWESNIDVEVGWNWNKNLTLIWWIYANNKNKAETQQIIWEMVKLLRYDRVNYKWYKYDDNYDYYEVKSAKDSDVIRINVQK